MSILTTNHYSVKLADKSNHLTPNWIKELGAGKKQNLLLYKKIARILLTKITLFSKAVQQLAWKCTGRFNGHVQCAHCWRDYGKKCVLLLSFYHFGGLQSNLYQNIQVRISTFLLKEMGESRLLNPVFISMKQLGVFNWYLPGWDASRRLTYICTPWWRDLVSCHNRRTQAVTYS